MGRAEQREERREGGTERGGEGGAAGEGGGEQRRREERTRGRKEKEEGRRSEEDAWCSTGVGRVIHRDAPNRPVRREHHTVGRPSTGTFSLFNQRLVRVLQQRGNQVTSVPS